MPVTTLTQSSSSVIVSPAMMTSLSWKHSLPAIATPPLRRSIRSRRKSLYPRIWITRCRIGIGRRLVIASVYFNPCRCWPRGHGAPLPMSRMIDDGGNLPALTYSASGSSLPMDSQFANDAMCLRGDIWIPFACDWPAHSIDVSSRIAWSDFFDRTRTVVLHNKCMSRWCVQFRPSYPKRMYRPIECT